MQDAQKRIISDIHSQEGQKLDLRGLTKDELEQLVADMGERPFRAKQINAWRHRPIASYDEMTNLPLSLRDRLQQKAELYQVSVAEKYVSKKDGTVKYLLRLYDGECVECVVMRYHHGLSVCISTQVGCAMGCRFCASTIGGKKRDLLAGEILSEVIFAQQDMGERISNIVLMGIGEPLDNFENVRRFLINVNDSEGLGIGYRHISLSTCGLVSGIDRLAELNLPITLSISLHAPDDETRSKIMPVNRKYDIDALIQACRRYQAVTGRRISFEYAMIAGLNDSGGHAGALAVLLRGLLSHVNLIPVNPIAERNFCKSNAAAIQKFVQILEAKGIPVTIRRELGSDISASCGQLRKKHL